MPNSYYEKFIATGEVKCIDEEIPFEVPNCWEWCKIKHLFSMQAGKNIKANELFDVKSDRYCYPCYGGNGLRGYVDHYNTEGKFVLIGRQGALCGNVKIGEGKFYATEHAVVTDGYGLTSLLWAYYFLMALNLNQYATATAQPGLAVSNIIEVLIPLPPRKEQKRIVIKLDEAISFVERYNDSQQKLDRLNAEININLRKSILQEAIQGCLVPQDPNDEPASVLLEKIQKEKQRLLKEGILKKDLVSSTIFKGDDNKYYEQVGSTILDISEEIPFEEPNSWGWCRLKDICSIFTGATFKKEDATTDSIGIRIWRGGNILPFALTNKPDDLFLPKEKVKDNILLQKNDIVTPAVTSLENIGKMARVESDIPNTTVGGFVFIIRPFLSLEILSQYLLDLMSSPTLIEPIPPLSEQERIVSKVLQTFDKIKG